MTGRIAYKANGERAYFVNGHEVSKEGYDLCFPSKLDEMLAEGRAPHAVTDASFMKGQCNGSQFANNPKMGDMLRKVAEANGGSVKGKKYVGGLARFPGDPRAWVDSRGDVQRICEQEGWGCEGTVNVKSRQPLNPPAPGPALADDIVQEEVAKVLETVPEKARKKVDVQDLKEQIVDKHAHFSKKSPSKAGTVK